MVKAWGIGLAVLLVFTTFAYAQEKSSSADDLLEKMKTALNLTPQQVDALKPVVKENLAERKQLRQNLRQQGITDKVAIKEQMDQLKAIENQRLSQILSADQMNKWIEKESLRAMLNPDQKDDAGDQPKGHRHGRHG